MSEIREIIQQLTNENEGYQTLITQYKKGVEDTKKHIRILERKVSQNNAMLRSLAAHEKPANSFVPDNSIDEVFPPSDSAQAQPASTV